MKLKILVPVDFSSNSRVAADYAFHFGLALDAELLFLNSVFIDAPETALVGMQVVEMQKERLQAARLKMDTLIEEVTARRRKKPFIQGHVVAGQPVEEVIETFADKHGIDIIIMGTKGMTGLARNILGSNTAAVISNSLYPVIAVPGSATFSGIKQLAYATDMRDIEQELKGILPIAKYFKATLHIIHVLPERPGTELKPLQIESKLKSTTGYNKIKFFYAVNSDINKGIDEYLGVYGADMLTMFTHKLNFWEKLMGQSVTRQEAFHTSIPVLTFKKTQSWWIE